MGERTRQIARDGVEVIVPEGLAPPVEVPAEIFRRALAIFLEPRRLDMQALALELGMGRSSLYRKVGGRDVLLSALLWYLARRSLVRALETTTDRSGSARVLAVIRRFLHDVHASAGLHRFLHEEPELALRILTSKRGGVQRPMIDTVERLLAAEETVADVRLDRSTLAYVIVRIAESFLYADVIADNDPDVERATEVIAKLLGTPRDTRR